MAWNDLVDELVRLYGEDVEVFISVVVPAGFPEGVLNVASGPRAVYYVFWRRMITGLEEYTIRRILDELRRNCPGSDLLRGLTADSLRARGRALGNIGPAGLSENEPIQKEILDRNVRRLTGKSVDDVMKCSHGETVPRDCWLRPKALSLVEELCQSNRAMAGTQDLLMRLTRLEMLVEEIDFVVRSGRTDELTEESRLVRLGSSVGQVMDFFSKIKDYPPEHLWEGKNTLKRLKAFLKLRIPDLDDQARDRFASALDGIRKTCDSAANMNPSQARDHLVTQGFKGLLVDFLEYVRQVSLGLKGVLRLRGEKTSEAVRTAFRECSESGLRGQFQAAILGLPHNDTNLAQLRLRLEDQIE